MCYWTKLVHGGEMAWVNCQQPSCSAMAQYRSSPPRQGKFTPSDGVGHKKDQYYLSSLWSLASLAYQATREWAYTTQASHTLSGIGGAGERVAPGEKLLCFDLLYYIGLANEEEWWKDYAPYWPKIGVHLHWAPPLLELAQDYLRRHFKVQGSEPIPPFISVHHVSQLPKRTPSTSKQSKLHFFKDYSPYWSQVGTHMRWNRPLVELASQYLRRHFGIENATDPIPPFISVHVRRSDFEGGCGKDVSKEQCFAPVAAYERRVQEVRARLKARTTDVQEILVTSDERDSVWWEQVSALGSEWRWIDHAVEKTSEKYGKWYVRQSYIYCSLITPPG
ncbi:hypothetical protein RSAG8_00122, partial [Rhizoctonia solani AG-8 WAC10335]